MTLKTIGRAAIIGGGPAGLMAADVLAQAGAAVTLYERMPSLGRKFLLAGRGGLNLTHSEPLETFMPRYREAAAQLAPAIDAFPPDALCAFAHDLGQSTFVGSSGRVFPTAMKASPLLRAWLRRLDGMGVTFSLRHRWRGWDRDALLFDTPDGEVRDTQDATILALGGASWPKLGSDGAWAQTLNDAGIAVAPLRPANCGFLSAWSDMFRDKFEGQPLKRIALHFGDDSVTGELLITRDGLEGGAIYALAPQLRDAIGKSGEATLRIDLKPDMPESEIAEKLAAPRAKQSLSNFLRKSLSLPPAAIGLMQEVTKGKFGDRKPAGMAAIVRSVRVRLSNTAPIARAISSAGGIRFDALDANYMLKHKPGIFAAGEMLDWEAPTGGYLLQASFATGAAAARGALAWMARQKG